MLEPASTFDPPHVQKLMSAPLVGRFLSFRDSIEPSAARLNETQADLGKLDTAAWVNEEDEQTTVTELEGSEPTRIWIQRRKASIPQSQLKATADKLSQQWWQLPFARLRSSLRKEALSHAKKSLAETAFRSTKLHSLLVWPPSQEGLGNRGWLQGKAPVGVIDRRLLRAFGVFAVKPMFWPGQLPWEPEEDSSGILGWRELSMGLLWWGIHHGTKLDADVRVDSVTAKLGQVSVNAKSLEQACVREGFKVMARNGASAMDIRSVGVQVQLDDGDTVGLDIDQFGLFRCRVPAARGGIDEERLQRRFLRARKAIALARDTFNAVLPGALEELSHVEEVEE